MSTDTNIPFYKMQGTGNDFVVLDNRNSRFSTDDLIELSPKLCNRKYGVGADGLLALQKPRMDDTDYEMLYRNADGSDAGMCGNGSRCLALFASRMDLGEELTFSVHEKVYRATIQKDKTVTVEFPLSITVQQQTLDDYPHILYRVFTGTEHVVREAAPQELQNTDRLIAEGKQLRHHKSFQPKGTNANFFQGVNTKKLELQTYERGVEDLTLACGTGAIASALTWHHIQQLDTIDNEFEVQTAGGVLRIHFRYDPESKAYSQIKLSGPAVIVFEGTFYV